ncbi:MAG: AIR synthase-related protein [Chloroflexota bacterium]
MKPESWCDIETVPGKVSSRVFEQVIKPALGRTRPDVLVGPQAGVDVGIVDIGSERVMAMTCDPLFVMPEYGWQRAAWFAIHIVASDAATSGLAPSLCTLDLNLPRETSDADFASLWEAIHETCADIGIAIVTGHTGRYDGCSFPMIGACTVMGVGARNGFVTPAMARKGDGIVMTKGAAIETVGQLGVLFAGRISRALGSDIARHAAGLFDEMSVVRDAAVAAGFGLRDNGVTAMHDATERGVWGGLVEIAQASGTGLIVEQAAVPVSGEVRAVCDLFEIDLYSASSEGTLLLTCTPTRVASLLDWFDAHGIHAAHIGHMTPAEEGIRVVRHGQEQPLRMPDRDPFWPALTRARLESPA